jgi:hypothetical protein
MYNRRDQIGHWVRRDQEIFRPCRHACCRGYRAHPSNWPLIPASHALRRATDDELARHYSKVTQSESPRARGVELQIISEFERRDRREMKRLEREQHRRARRISAARTRASWSARPNRNGAAAAWFPGRICAGERHFSGIMRGTV